MATLMIIDDSEKIVQLVTRLLVQKGHEVFSAKDSFSAMEYLEHIDFDLLLLDVNMPYKDGFTTLRMWRANQRFKDLPVAFLTGRNSHRDIERAKSLSAMDYILKPIQPELFLQKVDSLLDCSYSHPVGLAVPVDESIGWAQITSSSEGQITHISQAGVSVKSSISYPSEHEIFINSPLFNSIGIDPPTLKVFFSERNKEEENFTITLEFMHLAPESHHRIKQWIEANNPFEKE